MSKYTSLETFKKIFGKNCEKEIYKMGISAMEEIEKLKRENKIMENYLQLIIDIGYDYDGYNDVEGLKSIIDELVQYASLGKNKNDKKSMSIDGNNKRYNILGEKIGEDNDKD